MIAAPGVRSANVCLLCLALCCGAASCCWSSAWCSESGHVSLSGSRWVVALWLRVAAAGCLCTALCRATRFFLRSRFDSVRSCVAGLVCPSWPWVAAACFLLRVLASAEWCLYGGACACLGTGPCRATPLVYRRHQGFECVCPPPRRCAAEAEACWRRAVLKARAREHACPD